MDSTARAAVEADVRARFEAGDLAGAVRVALEAYGSEIYGFLVGLARDAGQADDAFGATCEALWKGLPGFRWEATFRVWAYTVARNELMRMARSTSRREVPVSEFPELAEAMLYARTSTPLHQRTAVKEMFARLRETLEPDDHVLLGLRLDRKLGWTEIARVLGEEDPAQLGKKAAALRKRFERLKERLREQVVGS